MNKGYILTTSSKYDQSLALSSRLQDVCNFDVDVVIGITPDHEEFKKLSSTNINPSFNGRDYLTPGEVCCAYGHSKILRKHMVSNADMNMIVFEDDVILEIDKLGDLTYLDSAMNVQPGIHILGGQHGLKLEKYFALRSTFASIPLLKLERMKVYRTCCYAVSASILDRVADFRFSKMSCCIDDWNFISIRTKTNIFFKNIFSHPKDLQTSLIETERRNAK